VRYRPLCRSGLLVSVVGLGCNQFGTRLDLAQTTAVLDAAQDVGITLLDTAESYGRNAGVGRSEELIGEALQGRRDEFVIATKFGHPNVPIHGEHVGGNGSRAWMRRSVVASLQRLRTDHIDLYQLHAPDPVTPMEETVGAMQDLVTEGLVRYLGHSQLAGWQVSEFAHLSAGGPAFISAQNHYSLLERDIEATLVPACEHHGVGILPFFPLAMGLLTGKITRSAGIPGGTRLEGRDDYVTDDKLDRVEALSAWSADHGHSLLETAIAALGAQPMVGSVIAGATSGDQVRANAAAADWAPSPEELAEVDAICPTKRG
jgi:aryl-alcohol dehydrogenase-like predicted oxidoreductase